MGRRWGFTFLNVLALVGLASLIVVAVAWFLNSRLT
jgi:type II secretory pathway component PulJ